MEVQTRKAGRLRGKEKASARMGRRDRRKLATREALLDAANALLHSRSMDALSVDEIVERADVARGTFYNYFSDKDDLERELASRTRARIENDIARLNVGIKDPLQRIARAFCSVLRFCISAPQDATAMMRLFPRATDPTAPVNAGVRRDAAEGMSQGRITAASQDVVVAYVMGVFLAGVNRALDLPAQQVPAFATGLGTILVYALGVRRTEAERIARDAVEVVLV